MSAKKSEHKPKSDTKDFEKLLEEKEELIKRVQADFDNYRKFVDREKNNIAISASSEIIRDLLPVLDDMEAAVKNEKDETIRKGIEGILRNMSDTLRKHGLQQIDSVEHKFDPHLHEALMKEKSDKEDGTVLEEFQKGYMLNHRVLRHSKVKIAG
ncbi:MAG: nucleotide exchange factor GrpE [Candidatus Aenigmarchaeota archaeon]|nr:nucleotide exchange factor GrpE [Candidatus Aenigmarchaeota archaeon]